MARLQTNILKTPSNIFEFGIQDVLEPSLPGGSGHKA